MSDARSDELHKWIGYSITAWAKVEERLFELCWRSLGSSKERAAIVYFKTPSLAGRISLVDELIKTVLPKPERKDGAHHHQDVITWTNLRKKIEPEFATRRRIAHHPAGYRKVIAEIRPSDEPPGELAAGVVHMKVAHEVGEFYRPEIYMSENEILRGKGVIDDPLFIGAVQSYSERINSLADELQHFLRDVFLKHIG
jgi:hypothetical protein